MMVFYSDRKKIVDAYEEWLKENPTIKDCQESLVAFMVGEDLVKSRTETDFYGKEPLVKIQENINESNF
jgi:hypothetical protein